MGRFPVLMYHRIESARCPVTEPEERPWAVGRETFERQLDRMSELGRVGVSMADVHDRLAGGGEVPPDWVAITFDDGNRSDHDEAVPLLAIRGFRATFFVCGRRAGSGGELTPEMIRTMRAAGMHIGSHAMTHRFLTSLSGEDEAAELRESRALLESIAGVPVTHFAPPGGRWSSRTARALREAGYTAVSTSVFGFNDPRGARFAYRRLPVVRATSAANFDAMVLGRRERLWPAYARALALKLARGVLGETLYGRARRLRPGD